jgi:integrase/recombinase XerD
MNLQSVFPRRHKLRAEVVRGPLGPYMDGFIDSVSQVGYTPGSFKSLIQGAVDFGRYLSTHRFTDLRRLTDQFIRDFIESTPVRVARGKYLMHVSPAARAASHVLRYLRQIGVAPAPPLPPPSPFTPLLDEWVAFLRHHRGLAEKSISLYRCHVSRFLNALGPDATASRLKRVTIEQVRSYLCKQGAAYGRSERKALTSTLRIFLGFAWDRGYLKRDLRLAVERVPTFKHEHLPRGPRWEDALRLLQTPDRSTVQGRRDYAILLTLITYGVRACQLVNLNIDDLDWRAMKIRFQAAKGGRVVEAPLTHLVGKAIVDYLCKTRPPADSRRLFLTLRAPVKPLLSGSVYNVVFRAFLTAGISSPHRGSQALRHAWATRMLSTGRPLKVIADLMGHRQIDTTRIYTKVDFGQLRQVALPWPQEVSR